MIEKTKLFLIERRKKKCEKILNRYLYNYFKPSIIQTDNKWYYTIIHELKLQFFRVLFAICVHATTFNWKQLFVVHCMRFHFDRIRRKIMCLCYFQAANAAACMSPFTGKMSFEIWNRMQYTVYNMHDLNKMLLDSWCLWHMDHMNHLQWIFNSNRRNSRS